jgi:hypothetical protein
VRRVLVSFACVVAPLTVALAGTVEQGSYVAAGDSSTSEPDTTVEVTTTSAEPTSTTTTEPSTTTTTTTDPATTTTESTTTSSTTTSTTTTSTTTTTTVPAVVPDAPQLLTATPANQSVTLQWTAPTSNGGAAISDYLIERWGNASTGWVPVADPVSTATSRTLTGLVNGTLVHFRVRAVNGVGPSVPSNLASATPRTVPTAPRALSTTPIAAGHIRLSWLAPTSTGGSALTDYVIQRSPNGTTGWVPVTDGVNVATTYTVTSLSTTTPTFFRVFARNVAGQSTSSSNTASAIARVKPSVVRNVAVTAGASGQLRLSWLAPASTGGASITDYVIARSLNGSTGWTTLADGVNTATTYIATGLTNGTRYYFRIYAKNVAGFSVATSPVLGVPRTVPTAPRTLVAAPGGSGQVRLSWVAPASHGGAAITDYVIQRSPTGTGSWTPVPEGVSAATSYTVGGLTNGARYYFRVYARNAAGYSPSSNIINATPRTVPSAPTAARAARGSFSVTVTWGPSSNGGAAVSRYVLERSASPGGPWTPVSSSIHPTIRSYTVSGLSYGRRYYFRVAAVNAAGRGAWSAVVSAVPTAPGSTCHPSYPAVCIPPSPPDLDCPEIPYQNIIVITPPAPYTRDPHRFDLGGVPGIGCES